MELSTLTGTIAIALNALAFTPYIVDTLRGRTQPHQVSWLLWTLITGAVFLAQRDQGAGIGAWVTGVTTAIDLAIWVLAFRYGTSNITTGDKACLACGMAIWVFWLLSDSLLLSILLVTAVDAVAFVPTIRKAWAHPASETFITYPISAARCALGILALEHYNVITAAYPVAMLLLYGLVTGVLLHRDTTNARRLSPRWVWRHYADYFRFPPRRF